MVKNDKQWKVIIQCEHNQGIVVFVDDKKEANQLIEDMIQHFATGNYYSSERGIYLMRDKFINAFRTSEGK